MDGVVCHVEEEGLSVAAGLVERMDCFARERLREEGIGAPVLLEPRDGEERLRRTVGAVAVVLLAQVAGRSSGGVAGDVDLEPEVVRVLARGVDGAEVGLAAVDGVVAVAAQQLDERGGAEGAVDLARLEDAVDVPLGQLQRRAFVVGRLVALERPVGDAVPRGVAPREQAAARRRTDARGVGLGEEGAHRGQTLHRGGLEEAVVGGLFAPEGDRGVLPPHVVDHEEDDVGALRPGVVGAVRIAVRSLGRKRKCGGRQKKALFHVVRVGF